MAESSVAVTPGAGALLHADSKSIGGSTVLDEYILHGEPFLATYVVSTTTAISTATAASHLIQVMSGATLNVYLRRISVYQFAVATAAAITSLQLFRLTTAGTGGTAFTPNPISNEAAAGATAMTLPTVKGTEAQVLGIKTCQLIQTVPTGGAPGVAPLLAEWDFEKLRGKALRIPSGAANGLAVKNPTAIAGATVVIEIVLSEANF